MTASALNIASVAPNAAAGGLGQGASAAGAAPGGKAGFEALLAAMFPQASNMPAPISATEGGAVAPMLVKGQLLVAEAEGDAAAITEITKTDTAGEPVAADVVTTDAAAEALAAAAVVAAPVQPQPQPQATAPVEADAPAPQAFGRDKSKGAIFQPVGSNPAQAAIEDADVETLDAAPAETADAPAPQQRTAANTVSTTPRAAQAPASVPAAPAAPAPAADMVDVAAASPPPVAEAPVEVAQAPTAQSQVVQSQALAAGQAAPKAEPSQPVVRPTRAERSKAGSEPAAAREPEVAAFDAADKPQTAKAATGAAKSVASVEVAAPETTEAREAQAKTPDATPLADARPATQQAAPAAHTAIPVRGSPETVAHLAANIAKKLEGQSTRFDLELNPHGLGKVDVRVEIGASGQMTAAMLFDSPEAAQELKARAAELQRALEQAGFDLSGGLSFDVAGDTGRQGQAWQDQGDNTGRASRGQAFRAALETAGEADIASQGPLRLRRGVTAGLDVRI